MIPKFKIRLNCISLIRKITWKFEVPGKSITGELYGTEAGGNWASQVDRRYWSTELGLASWPALLVNWTGPRKLTGATGQLNWASQVDRRHWSTELGLAVKLTGATGQLNWASQVDRRHWSTELGSASWPAPLVNWTGQRKLTGATGQLLFISIPCICALGRKLRAVYALNLSHFAKLSYFVSYLNTLL